MHYDAKSEEVTIVKTKVKPTHKEPVVSEKIKNLENSLETLEKLECERGSSENVAGSVFH
jgi:hypothetical protein